MVIELFLNNEDLTEAVRAWVEKKGFVASDRFAVNVEVMPGERPVDVSHMVISVTGVLN